MSAAYIEDTENYCLGFPVTAHNRRSSKLLWVAENDTTQSRRVTACLIAVEKARGDRPGATNFGAVYRRFVSMTFQRLRLMDHFALNAIAVYDQVVSRCCLTGACVNSAHDTEQLSHKGYILF
jgi:hypothetical protein